MSGSVLSTAPAVASVQTFVVQEPDSVDIYDVFAQRYASDGSKIGGPILVSSPDLNDTYGEPAQPVTVRTDGSFSVLYYMDNVYNTGVFVETDVDAQGEIVNGPYVVPNTPVPTSSLTLGNGGVVDLFNTFDNSNASGDFFGFDSVSFTLILPDGRHVSAELGKVESDFDTGETFSNVTGTVDAKDDFVLSYDLLAFGAVDTQYVATYDDKGELLSRHTVQADRTADTSTFDPATGKLLTDYVRHPDGSFDTQQYGITGKPYVDQEASYDRGGRLLSMTRHYADGSVALSETRDPDGSLRAISNDALHREISSTLERPDGSGERLARGYKGNSYNVDTIQHIVIGAGGVRQMADVTNADGSHRQTAFVAGLTLTSTPGVADVLVAAGAGTTRFAVGTGDGHDTILGFRAGTGAGHGVLAIDAPGITNFQQLSAHLTQAATGALITIDADDTILLRGVAPGALTAGDFLF